VVDQGLEAVENPIEPDVAAAGSAAGVHAALDKLAAALVISSVRAGWLSRQRRAA